MKFYIKEHTLGSAVMELLQSGKLRLCLAGTLFNDFKTRLQEIDGNAKFIDDVIGYHGCASSGSIGLGRSRRIGGGVAG